MQLDSPLVPALPITFQEMQGTPPIVRARLDNVVRVATADIGTIKTNEARLEYWQQIAAWALKNHDETAGRMQGAEIKAMAARGSVNEGTAG